MGPPRIELDDDPLSLSRRKALALLAYLAIEQQPQSRDSLAAFFWPEYSQCDARTDLSRTLSYLNRTLGEGWLLADRQRIGISPKSDTWVDVVDFQQLVSQGMMADEHAREEQLALLTTAVNRYQGDFMADFSLPDSPAFDDWLTLQTQSLQQQLGQILEQLSQLHSAQEDHDSAISLAQRWLSLDRLHEQAHRQLMLLYAWSGQQTAALRQFHDCERILQDEVGVGADAATVELFEAIKAGQVSTPFAPGGDEPASPPYGAVSVPMVPPLAVPQPDEPTLFVGRNRELRRMDAFLQRALSGQGHVIFVTGEAGAGKTALVSEFIRRSQDTHPNLLVAYGNCNAQTGSGDPYLPFRELLAMLTADVSVVLGTNVEDEESTRQVSQENVVLLQYFLPESGRILVEDGPELIDRFVSGNGLVQRAAQLVPQKRAWVDQLMTHMAQQEQMGFPDLDQSRIFEQITTVLQAMTAQKPLVLILDDLHWVDGASANLLFHVARRIGQSRLLLIGAYRPEDIAADRNDEQHPLQQIASELKRQEGDVWIDLNELQKSELREFTGKLIDSEPNRLDEAFREALLRHTGGHALFTVELLRTLQDQGDLLQDERGYWVEAAQLDWDALPARVEGAIEKRIGLLDKELHEILAVACAEGEEFTVEVIAQVQDIEPRKLVRQLSRELGKQSYLVESQGVKRVGQQRLSRYRFRHNLYQKYLYNRLSDAERCYLHEDIAIALEKLYADQCGEVAGQLAWHYQEAELPERAIPYLQHAGDKASEKYAIQEAMSYFSQGLSLLESLTETPEQVRLEVKRQTALSSDLHTSLQQLTSRHQSSDLLPDRYDIVDRFEFPEKLYGREQEIEALLAAFDRVSCGTTEVLLVTGYAGIGKTSLIHAIHESIQRQNGYFISGKFDQLNRNVPYSAIIQAFQELVRQMMIESGPSIVRWKRKLLDALGSNGQVIVDVIPELAQIVGKQPPVPSLGTTEAQNRFRRVFGQFATVFARREHPLVLFLDDLQWADLASLDLLQTFAIKRDESSLFLIGAYRDNEVDRHHPLSIQLDEMMKEGAHIHEITLDPLKRPTVNQLIADLLDCSYEQVQSLAELVLHRTEGNPFFVKAFLTALYEEDMLRFDPISEAWRWEMAKIEQKPPTENVVELMVNKISQLPKRVQDALKLAACIGNHFDPKIIAALREQPTAEIEAQLRRCVKEGLIVKIDETYQFYHDRIQEAAYRLISEEDKTELHYIIGQLLLKRTGEHILADRIFDIVDQLNLGRELLADRNERNNLAKLNLMAGQKAKRSTAYQAASGYFVVGIELLPQETWTDDYELAFEIHLEAAECEYLCGGYERAEALFPTLFKQARTNIDKAKVYAIQILQYTNLNQFVEAARVGTESLKLFGVALPEADVDVRIELELKALKANLADRTPESMLDIPEMADPEKRMFLRLASYLYSPFNVARPKLALLLRLKAVNCSLTYGYATASVVAYGSCGQMLGTTLGEYKLSYELAQLGMMLSETFNNVEFRCKAYYYAAITSHWCTPKKIGNSLLRKAYQAGQESGDLLHTDFSCAMLILGYLTTGHKLNFINEEIEKYEGFLEATKNPCLELVLIEKQSMLALKGLTETRTSLKSTDIDDAKILDEAIKTSYDHLTFWYYVRKTHLALLYNEIPSALKMAQCAEKRVDGATSQISIFEHYFYYSLILAALYEDGSSTDQQHYWEKLKANQQQLQIWADNCLENFDHANLLVKAEMARITGEELAAMELYDQAIESAAENGFTQHEALSNELAARFWLNKGKTKFANLYLAEAHTSYHRWGATMKVRHLEETYPHLAT
ncbi:AAA family ATPase [Chloroflexi bacterium TSY]|nr:AAA family ATPase [Chloroflexi bacterium TSY]